MKTRRISGRKSETIIALETDYGQLVGCIRKPRDTRSSKYAWAIRLEVGLGEQVSIGTAWDDGVALEQLRRAWDAMLEKAAQEA